MNAITMLERDHVKVKALLARLDSTTPRATVTRRDLFNRIKADLTVHETIEEEIFYPALKSHPRAKDIVLEGIEEHNVVDTLLGELTALSPSHETWGAKATVMRENLEHHIEEEETDMFVKARNIFDRAELTALGQRMAARKITARADVKRIAAKRRGVRIRWVTLRARLSFLALSSVSGYARIPSRRLFDALSHRHPLAAGGDARRSSSRAGGAVSTLDDDGHWLAGGCDLGDPRCQQLLRGPANRAN